MNYWLVKSDPGTYSVEDLKREKKTTWDGIRNHQARINLNSMKTGDLVLIYHSQTDKDVRAIAKVTEKAFKDTTAEDDRWVAVELTFVKELKHYVTLTTIKADKALAEVPLIRHTRLSVMPLSMAQYERIIELSESK